MYLFPAKHAQGSAGLFRQDSPPQRPQGSGNIGQNRAFDGSGNIGQNRAFNGSGFLDAVTGSGLVTAPFMPTFSGGTPLTEEEARARGVGVYKYAPRPDVMPPDFVPDSERADVATHPGTPAPRPVAESTAPRVLSKWPLMVTQEGSDFFGPVREIRPEYRFGQEQVSYMTRDLESSLLGWEQTYTSTIARALAPNPQIGLDYQAQDAASAAALVAEHLDAIQAALTPTINGLLLAANGGLAAAASAFNEISAELQAWPKGQLPEPVIASTVEYAKDWSYTTEKAAERFKYAAQSWTRIQARVARLIADERQLRQFAAARITEQRDNLQARVTKLEQQMRAMESGAGLLDSVRQQFERVLAAGKDAAGKALAAVGAALPDVGKGLGLGIGAAIAVAVVVGALALRRR